jgi:hypothetical protein
MGSLVVLWSIFITGMWIGVSWLLLRAFAFIDRFCRGFWW